MPSPIVKGNKLAKGGARAGSGRKPNWFKQLCEEEMAKNRATGIRLIGSISRGEVALEKVMIDNGKIKRAKVMPSGTEIIHANEFLRDSRYGKPGQAIKHTGEVGIDLFGAIRQAERERGLVSDLVDEENAD